MKKEIYKGKRVVWKSRSGRIQLILVSFLFVAVALLTKNGAKDPLYFWGSIIFFGGGGIALLVELLNPRNLFVKPGSELGKEIAAFQYQEREKDTGAFIYTETGFSLPIDGVVRSCQWTDIETIFGYKRDLMTVDEVCMDIFLSDGNGLQFTESLPGWGQFNKKLSEHIPELPELWETRIYYPAFETTLTLVYDRAGRTQQEAIAGCYPGGN